MKPCVKPDVTFSLQSANMFAVCACQILVYLACIITLRCVCSARLLGLCVCFCGLTAVFAWKHWQRLLHVEMSQLVVCVL